MNGEKDGKGTGNVRVQYLNAHGELEIAFVNLTTGIGRKEMTGGKIKLEKQDSPFTNGKRWVQVTK